MPAQPQRFDPRPSDPPLLPDGFDVPFDDAIEWARQRGAMLPDDFYGARLQSIRARSFTISGLAALDQIQQVADSLADATASGQTLREWQRTLPDEVLALGRARRELIFRNAVQTNYGIGRTLQQRENAAARPFLMWDAINDSRTRDSHRQMDGHIAPIDAPIWKRWHAPAGHNSLLPHQRVSGNAFVGLKAWYAGPVVEIVGQTGARLSVTAQHPILTKRGWVAAQNVNKGDQLVAYGWPVGGGSVAAELHKDNPPPTIEEVFNALGARARGTMPRSAVHLHGEARFLDGNVDVVAANRELMNRINAATLERLDQLDLALSSYAAGLAECARSAFIVAWRELRRLAGAHGSPQPAGCCAPHRHADAGRLEVRRQPLAIYIESRLKAAQVRAIAIEVADFLGNRLRQPGRRPAHSGARDQSCGFRFGPLGDTAFADVFVGGFDVNPNALADAMKAHPGLVEFEDVADVRLRNWAGHVYDLETASGNILAYGNTGSRHYIVSNCRCTRIALSEAQARARGYPKADPGVEPDKGWDGDPTDEDVPGRLLAQKIQRTAPALAEAMRLRGKATPLVDDPQRGTPDCDLLLGFAAGFATGDWCLLPQPGQTNWKDAGRPDLRRVGDDMRLPAPAMLAAAKTRVDAEIALAMALGLSEARPLIDVQTPVETAVLRRDLLAHMVEKEVDARERYANFILPTLRDPFEVWGVEYADGIRNRYIGLFKGERDFMVVLRVNLDGSLMWNVMQATPKDMNKHRLGLLRWGK